MEITTMTAIERMKVARAARLGCDAFMSKVLVMRGELVRLVDACDTALGTSRHELGEAHHAISTLLFAAHHTAGLLGALEDELLKEEALRS